MPPPVLHPPTNQLLAFGLGQLDLIDAVALEAHLQQCDGCCSRLDRLPADGLVSALRLAVRDPASDSWVALTRKHIPGLTGAVPPLPALPGSAGFPPELENHPRYRVTALVGHGGMGTVYRAEHTLMGRAVALKLIDPRLLEHAGALGRFRQEVMAAARLSHPNIVIAYDAEQAGSHHLLVMEFVEGTNLADYLRKRGRLDAGEACAYVRQAALGLQHALEKGMVHRDIKPHNLMLTPSGQVKMLDFGLARFLFEPIPDEDTCNALADTSPEFATCASDSAQGLTPAGSMMGTLDYMAPEQARDARHADIRADIYSLGCTLYELLTGQVPFPGGDARSKAARLVKEAPVCLSQLRPDLPKGLAALVVRMMARRPEDRYQTPVAVAAALAPYTDAVHPSDREEAPRRDRKRPTKRTVLAALALVLAVVTVGAMAMSVQTEQDDPTQEATGDRVTNLVRQLGDRKFAKREAASTELDRLGVTALPALRKAVASDDPEVRRRADRLIRGITHRLERTDVQGVPPPKGAIVLFDGKTLDAWAGRDGTSAPPWKLRDGGVMEAHEADIRTRQTFAGSYKLHVEFRVPDMPKASGHGRGNSGVYLHGRYEVQILDSFGPRAKAPGAVHIAPAESCGAIFGQTAPRVNACKAPGYWQSYDIEFHPPRFTDGRKDEHPRMTVFHNGVLIHNNVHVLVDDTGMGLLTDPTEPGPVMLQYHSCPVQFRNVWLVPLKPEQPARPEAAEVKRLIRQLGSPKFKKRDAAERRLEAIGEPALQALRRAAADDIAEIRTRAVQLIEVIDSRLPYLFNGRDLKRWQGLKGCWSVRDGALVGTTEPGGLKGFNTFLCSTKNYCDFELRFQVRLTGKGWCNSGVQIRSEIIDSAKWIVKGPQCDIGERYWGCLYGEQFGGMMKEAPRDVVARVLQPGEFNEYYIKCVGKRVTIKLNGHTTVDDEFPQLPEEGVIAWQLHGGEPMTVIFRNIEFRELNKN